MSQSKNYADSSAHCKSLGGILALPESAEENQHIMHEIGNVRERDFYADLLAGETPVL